MEQLDKLRKLQPIKSGFHQGNTLFGHHYIFFLNCRKSFFFVGFLVVYCFFPFFLNLFFFDLDFFLSLNNSYEDFFFSLAPSIAWLRDKQTDKQTKSITNGPFKRKEIRKSWKNRKSSKRVCVCVVRILMNGFLAIKSSIKRKTLAQHSGFF